MDQRNAKFPHLSICPSGTTHQAYKSEVLKKFGIKDYTRNWIGNNSSISPDELYDLATFDFFEIVDYIYIRYYEVDIDGSTAKGRKGYASGYIRNPKHKSNYLDFDVQILEQPTKQHGKCYTIIFGESIRKLGIYYTTMFL